MEYILILFASKGGTTKGGFPPLVLSVCVCVGGGGRSNPLPRTTPPHPPGGNPAIV